MNMKVEAAELAELEEKTLDEKVVSGAQLDLVKGVKVQLRALLGNTEMTVAELFDLKKNSIVQLDALKDSPIDLLLDDKIVARGSLVVVDENLGVQIAEVLDV